MIYLVLAVLSSMLIATIMRVSEKYIHNNISMLAFNYVMCSALAAFFTGTMDLLPGGEGFGFAFGFGIISGCVYLGSFILLQWNIAKNGVVLPAMFMKLGVMVPIVMSMLVFHEMPKVTQVIGIIAAISAIVMINSDKKHGKAASGLGLVALLLTGGGADATSKVYEELGVAAFENHFLFYTFFSALVICVIVCLVKKQSLTPVDVLFGLLVGIPNYFSALFLLQSLSAIPAVVAYPTYSVATIVAVTLVGMLAFGEKLSKRQLVSIFVILCALVLLNI